MESAIRTSKKDTVTYVILPSRSFPVSNYHVRSFAISALFASIFILLCSAQDPKRAAPREIQRCFPRLATPKVSTGASLADIHIRKGERYAKTPVIGYEVSESGEILNAFVKRGSGVADIDQRALRYVKELRFNKRPGCTVVDSEATVTVDFR